MMSDMHKDDVLVTRSIVRFKNEPPLVFFENQRTGFTVSPTDYTRFRVEGFGDAYLRSGYRDGRKPDLAFLERHDGEIIYVDELPKDTRLHVVWIPPRDTSADKKAYEYVNGPGTYPSS